jgi:hypothetical protein
VPSACERCHALILTWVDAADPNDGFGPDPASFDQTQYRVNGDVTAGGWRNSTWPTTSSCYLDPEFSCSRTNSRHFGFWTTNQ